MFKNLSSVHKVVVELHKDSELGDHSAASRAEAVVSKIQTKVYQLALWSMYNRQQHAVDSYRMQAPDDLTPSMEEAVELGFGHVKDSSIDESVV